MTTWAYDAAGNLLSDGTQTYTYDALGRVLTVGATSNSYNTDGTLVAQTQGSTTTRYVHDLAAPLSQLLSDGTQQYIYGKPAERLYGVAGSTRTWYSVDALGSLRSTLDDAGVPQQTAMYDAWGVPETAAIAPFGFTGEVQQGSDVWLRARWYGAGRGSFGARDPYAGSSETPYSLMAYQYGYSAPTMWTDPSGLRVTPGDNGGSCEPNGMDAAGHCRTLPQTGTIYTGPTQRLNPLQEPINPYTGPTERLDLSKGTPPETIRGGPGLGTLCLLLLMAFFLTGDTPHDRPVNPRIDPDYRKVLIVGEQPPYPYATKLAEAHPEWDIIGTSYGSSNSQDLADTWDRQRLPRLLLLKNVDATHLENGRFTRLGDFDDIIWNSPRADTGWADATIPVIHDFLSSAHVVLRSRGAARMSCTAMGWPCTKALEALWKGNVPPGYINKYRVRYESDFRFNIPMEWRRNDGTRLDPATQLYWYGFQKG